MTWDFTLAMLFAIIVLIFVSLWYMIRFTRQKVIDTLGLNRLLKVKKVSELTYTELKTRVAEIAWKRMKEAPKVILRNGWVIKEMKPLNAEAGMKYMVVARDNRPAINRCHVCFACNLIGTKVSPTMTIQDNRDYEYMVYLLGLEEKEAYSQLKAVNSGDKEMMKSIQDRYAQLVMREIL